MFRSWKLEKGKVLQLPVEAKETNNNNNKSFQCMKETVNTGQQQHNRYQDPTQHNTFFLLLRVCVCVCVWFWRVLSITSWSKKINISFFNPVADLDEAPFKLLLLLLPLPCLSSSEQELVFLAAWWWAATSTFTRLYAVFLFPSRCCCEQQGCDEAPPQRLKLRSHWRTSAFSVHLSLRQSTWFEPEDPPTTRQRRQK